jgi:hypothetical protein
MSNNHGYGKASKEVNLMMSEKKAPHERMTVKNNGLSSAQEVTYQNEFKKADNAVKNDKKAENHNHKS